MRYITAVTALMIANVLAAPPAPKTLLIRDPIDTRNLPGADKFCASQRYTPNEIRAAVNFAWQAKKDGVEYRFDNGKRKGKQPYPHQNTPTQGKLRWEDFNKPDCATGEGQYNTNGFLEFPIIPGGNPWKGGNTQVGFDRVVFQYVDDNTAAFCGIVHHINPSKFELCGDVTTEAKSPFNTGTCSLHLTQWDNKINKDGQDPSPRYDVEVKMFDNSKIEIGTQSRTGCDGTHPVQIASALEDFLDVAAQSNGDYVAFKLGGMHWPSNGNFGSMDTHNQCSQGNWDCNNGPCSRQMDCSFNCLWRGHESSAINERDVPIE